MTKYYGYRQFLLIGLIFLVGCSKDAYEDLNSSIDDFYKGADLNASGEKLSGIWAIFSAGFQGEKVDVPIIYESCSRDFFMYKPNGSYIEYVYLDSECATQVNELGWELEKGVLTLKNELGQSDESVITKLNDQELVFKTKFDVDEDGELDVLVLFAKKYEPNEPDLISESFTANTDDAFNNLLSLKWNAYNGVNEFDRYEIYRTVGQECSKTNTELIASIKDVSIAEYTDKNPPAEKTLCYYIKIYTDKGLLAKSRLIDLHTENILPDPVALERPLVFNDRIELNWEAYQSPYFSHYEVVFSNFPLGTGASGYQENTLVVIKDINTTTFTDINPPYLENPYYAVYAYNIFGNKSSVYNDEKISSWEITYKRNTLLPFRSIDSYAIDPEEPIIYFFGSINRMESKTIQRFNYHTQEIEAVSNFSPSYGTNEPIKFFDSPNGMEIAVIQGTNIIFYDAKTLEYKYAIDPEGVFHISDLNYTDNDIWTITDSDNVYTLERDNANLFPIDSAPHFPEHQGTFNYHVFALDKNRIMVGHENEVNSIVYTMDTNGNFESNKTVSIRARSYNGNKILFNPAGNYLLDLSQNRLYSGETFQYMESFETPYFPSGISKNGLKIYGINNDPDWEIKPESLHKKEAIIFDRNTRLFEKIETLGYPHLLFESYNGEVFSISSGLKKERLSQNINDRADIFIEKVNTY